MWPLSLIASIFGLHFKHLPLSPSPTAFLTVMLIMVVVIIFMVALFQLGRWLWPSGLALPAPSGT
jgi:Mg2+ and Co2+ transporter CorA